MKNTKIRGFLFAVILATASSILTPPSALAHCDGLDGPVVTAARRALESGNVNLVIIWVQKADEPEIRIAFQNTLAVRKLSPQARDLADMYFFETLVRVHRAGEGAPYTGLKPAGRDLGPAIPAGDKAIAAGSTEALLKLLTDKVREQIITHFKEVQESSRYSTGDVEAGRRYVKAYVEYIHYVEQLYDTAKHPPEGHSHESVGAELHEGKAGGDPRTLNPTN
jgi:hypothetical protein